MHSKISLFDLSSSLGVEKMTGKNKLEDQKIIKIIGILLFLCIQHLEQKQRADQGKLKSYGGSFKKINNIV